MAPGAQTPPATGEMPDQPQPETPETPAADAPAGEPDLSKGYDITLRVLPGGYQVMGPEPIEEEMAEEKGEGAAPGEGGEAEGMAAGGEGEMIEGMEPAMHKILEIVSAHPVKGGDQAGFESGYQTEKKDMGQEGALAITEKEDMG